MTALAADWPFEKVAHVNGCDRALGHKTVKSDVTRWRGRFDGHAIEFVAQARMSDAGAHFYTSSNARIRGDVGHAAQFLDVEVTKGRLTPEQLQRLAGVVDNAVRRGGTDWPVIVRGRGQPVRTGYAASGPAGR